jgi:Fe-S-cluster containining protein
VKQKTRNSKGRVQFPSAKKRQDWAFERSETWTREQWISNFAGDEDSAMRANVWYHKGLRFQCTGCGDCCTGDPGFVWVNAEEIAALAARVGLSAVEFEATYVRRVGARKSLLEYENGDCVMFDPERRSCRVYEARPRQCRTWPFWGSNVRTPEDWQETCRYCPGCGQGPLVSVAEIQRSVRLLRV